MNHLTGLGLHQLACPDPDFDPSAQITVLVTAVLRPLPAEEPGLPGSATCDPLWTVGSGQDPARSEGCR